MKSKRKRTLLILTTLFILGGVGLLKLNKDFLLLWNVNSIRVKTEKPLDKKKVKVRYGFSSINRNSDEELFSDFDKEKGTLLFDNGNSQDKIPNEYGENDFLITYDEKYYLSFRQFKLNRRHQHNYIFDFYEQHDSIFIKVNIKGIDGMKFERQLLEIEYADKHRCNAPIDSTKILYNGVELLPIKKKE